MVGCLCWGCVHSSAQFFVCFFQQQLVVLSCAAGAEQGLWEAELCPAPPRSLLSGAAGHPTQALPGQITPGSPCFPPPRLQRVLPGSPPPLLLLSSLEVSRKLSLKASLSHHPTWTSQKPDLQEGALSTAVPSPTAKPHSRDVPAGGSTTRGTATNTSLQLSSCHQLEATPASNHLLPSRAHGLPPTPCCCTAAALPPNELLGGTVPTPRPAYSWHRPPGPGSSCSLRERGSGRASALCSKPCPTARGWSHRRDGSESLPPLQRKWLTCCSKVMTVWTLKLPLSQGSVIPTDPGRKSPAARI